MFESAPSRVVGGVAAATLAAVTLAACVPNHNASEHPPVTPAITPDAPQPTHHHETEQPTDIVRVGPCQYDPRNEGNADGDKLWAVNCLRGQRYGSIALVNYAGRKLNIDKVAAEALAALKHASNGLVTPTIHIKQPTLLARTRFAEATSAKGCVNIDDFESWGSMIADEENEYPEDLVVAVSEKVACADSVVGIAERTMSRYADVFAGGTIPLKLDKIADAAAHETGHLYGLGHSGAFYNQTTSFGRIDYERVAKTKSFNLLQYMAKGDFYTYDPLSSSMMSAYFDNPYDVGLDPVEMAILKKPREIVNHLEPSIISVKKGEHIVLDWKQALNGKMADIELPTPVTLSEKPKDGEKLDPRRRNMFTDLVIVPESDAEYKKIFGAALFLRSEGHNNSTAELGTLAITPFKGTSARVKLRYGKGEHDVVTVRLTADGKLTIG